MDKIDALKNTEVILSHWREGLMTADEVYNRIVDVLHESLLAVGQKKKELAEAFTMGQKLANGTSFASEEMIRYGNSRAMESVMAAVCACRTYANASAAEIRGMVEYALIDKENVEDKLSEVKLQVEGILKAKEFDRTRLMQLLFKAGLRTGAIILYVNEEGNNAVQQGMIASGFMEEKSFEGKKFTFGLVDGTFLDYRHIRMVLKPSKSSDLGA